MLHALFGRQREDFGKSNPSESAQLGQNPILTQLMLLWEPLSVNQASKNPWGHHQWERDPPLTLDFSVCIS